MSGSEPLLYEWLENPEIFAVNRLPAHSDHCFYESEEDLQLKDQMPLRQSLNGEWLFSYAVCPDERQKDFYRTDFDVSGFAKIQVPGHIQLQGYDRCQYINTMYPWDGQEFLRPPHISREYNPVGSYVKFFRIRDEWKGKKIRISFQGVETAMYVWLNGHFIGYSEDTFTPSEFDLTDFVTDGENRLAVEVYKRSSASWIEDQDFWRFSGIFRDVYLYAVPDVHVRNIFAKCTLDESCTKGLLDLQAEVEQFSDRAYQIQAFLKDRDGNVLTAGVMEPSEDGIYRWNWESEEGGVKPWSAEQPNLYALLIFVFDISGGTIEVSSMKVGFRRFELRDGVMRINGKRIIFRGVNRHEFGMKSGRSIGREEMLWDIRFMKQHNINAVRTSHYPNQSYWYQLCDEYGIYLIDETNLESHGSWQKLGAPEPSWNVPGSLPEWEACVVDRARSMFERDKNHPSIVIWSCGNESYAGEDILKMSQFFHEHDDSRIVHYEGVFWNRDFDQISDVESRMYAKPADIEEYLKADPPKPYISCEYMHAMGNSCGGLSLYTDLEDRYEKYQGGFIWDYIDQSILTKNELGEEVLIYGGDSDDRATDYEFCGNGIVFADRKASPKAQEVKQLYAPVRITADGRGAEIENRNLFTDTSEYLFIFRVLENGACVRQSAQTVRVDPLSKAYVQVDIFNADPVDLHAERVHEVDVCLKHDTKWGRAGDRICFGQAVICPYENELSRNIPDGNLEVIEGDVNIGVKGKGFHIMFSKAEGGIASLVYEGREFITRAPKCTFWRAATDNDRGAGYGFERGMWMTAGLFQKNSGFEWTLGKDRVTVVMKKIIPTVPETELTITYEVFADGEVTVNAEYEGQPTFPGMPAFGMDIRLKERYHNYKYYGYGPDENYTDRSHGAALGIYSATACENLTPYLVPQECGNRMGTRWLEVTDDNGAGLIFECLESPFESSVLPVSEYELENAAHQEELPKPHYTWVRILGEQMGVGGDDSWGAPVHDEFLIPAGKKMTVSFVIKKR